MRKVLLAFDGIHFSEGAFEFARKMNELNPGLLTGIFLPQADYASLWSYGDTMIGPVIAPLIKNIDEEKIEENIARFKMLCQKHGIEYQVHEDSLDFALPELKKETRFADLLILGSESFYENMGINEPNDYLKGTLRGVECPVLIVPEKFDFPLTNILSYDGSDSSVFAIKQYAYLLPEFTSNPTLLVYARDEGGNEIPAEINIEELVVRHFPDLTVTKLDINPGKQLDKWITEKKSTILISGSFGRSFLSRIFKKSFISGIIKSNHLPIFIAHR